jgi:hypothetical protein
MSIPNPNELRPADPDEELRRLEDRQRMVRYRNEKERRELLQDWLAGGGTEEEFEQVWPEIQAQIGRFRVMELGEKARNRSLMRFRKQD